MYGQRYSRRHVIEDQAATSTVATGSGTSIVAGALSPGPGPEIVILELHPLVRGRRPAG
jgi:hypothetical protein